MTATFIACIRHKKIISIFIFTASLNQRYRPLKVLLAQFIDIDDSYNIYTLYNKQIHIYIELKISRVI